MQDHEVSRLIWWADIDAVAGIAAQTREYLCSSPSPLAIQIAKHLSAYNSAGDVIPFFGDFRLPYTESFLQLRNAVSLAYHGFYNQAFSALRSVCELSLLQSSLPEGEIPSEEEVNIVWFTGQLAAEEPSSNYATSLKEWAIDGCKIPRRNVMLNILFESKTTREFDYETNFRERLEKIFIDTDQYIHVRGWQRSAINLGNGGLRFSEKSLSLFGSSMMISAQLSITMLLVTFLPRVTKNSAAAGFIDPDHLYMAIHVLPKRDAQFLNNLYEERSHVKA